MSPSLRRHQPMYLIQLNTEETRHLTSSPNCASKYLLKLDLYYFISEMKSSQNNFKGPFVLENSIVL